LEKGREQEMKTAMITRIALAVVVILGLSGSAWAFSGAGSGTVGDPYIITDVNQLQEMQYDLDAYYELGNDIDASDTVNWNGGAGFEPVGSYDPNYSFTGTLDGRGHVITGLYIYRPSSNSIALFSGTFGAEIKNFGLIDVDITGSMGIGALVNANMSTTISKCWSSGEVKSTFIGANTAGIGGLVGVNMSGSIISKCYSTVNVTGNDAWQYGGLAGRNHRGAIIEDCYATGNVTGTSKVGGLVGDNQFGADGGYVTRCYSTGLVTGNGGGLIGYNWQGGVTYDSYWDTVTSGKTTSKGGTGKTTSEMKQKATFVGWDFAATWDIVENSTYPFLRGVGVSTGPVAHWKLDEGSGAIAYDSAGTNDGTISGAVWTTGLLGGALDFDGVDDYVEFASVAALQGDSLTALAWIRVDEFAGLWNPVLTQNDSNGNGYYFYIVNDRPSFYIVNGAAFVQVVSTETINADKWYHVAGTNDGTNLKLYVDGQLEDSKTSSGYTGFNSNAYIGFEPTSMLYYKGLIDDVRVYDRALTTVEIEGLYNSVPPPPVGETYHVDGATGDNTNDGLSRGTAFATIQRGINAADDYDTVLVWPGVYNEEIALWGDAITVKSAAAAAIVETNYGYAFSFFSAEEPNTVLSNFVIRNSQYGIYLINGASPTLRNLTIVNNDFGISAFNGSDPVISNCILWGNYYGDLFRDPVPLEAKYSFVQEEVNEPIAHWKFDEGSGSVAYDSVGTNDGMLVNGPTWTTGQLGSALDFDGVDDYVDIGLYNYGPEIGFTWSAWINTDNSEQLDQCIFDHSDGANTEDMRLVINDSIVSCTGFVFLVDPSGGTRPLNDKVCWNPVAGVQSRMWYHVVGVMDYASMKIQLYVDGVKKGESDWSGTPINRAMNGSIGNLNVSHSRPFFFNGLIDEVAIYNQALSDEEVQRIYQNSAGPLFVDTNNGDYHLLSERGRYWPAHDVWVLDDVTSPCIDGGDPAVDPSDEPMPYGGRINMGAYGGTAYASMSEWPLKHDSNFDGVVNMLDLAGLALEWLEGDAAPVPPPPPPPDTTPPAPVPAIISIQAVSPSSISMTSSVAFDVSGVQYYFEALSAGGHDSGWIGEPNYADVNLVPGATYCYRVKARDKSLNSNETIWSPQVCLGSPPPPDTLPPLPDPMQWDPVVDANGYDGLPREILLPPFGVLDYGATMRAIDADDVAPPGVPLSEVEYYFECQDDGGFNSGWRTVAAYPNEDERRIYTVRIGGSGHAYVFRVKARDASNNLNETDWSAWYPALYLP
jgi:parallel beta-helix repeat protein